jgi:predicted transcriptional regulator of viral defense system
MVNLSDRAITVISNLEFKKKYYFLKEDIRKHFSSDKQLYDFIYNQRKNERIIKLNKNKYFLIPIKARFRKWTDNPLIVADEIMNGSNYYVGGWYAAKYWKLTEQIPMQIDIYSTKKFGKMKIMNKKYVFHRIRIKALEKGIKKNIEGHQFIILKKNETQKWISKK